MRKDTLNFLRRITEAPSPSGYEGPARRVWTQRVKTSCERLAVDIHGNAIATTNPTGRPRVMLAGHIDELGFQITHIEENGYMRFRPIGGHDLNIVSGRRVHIHTSTGDQPAVIGRKPIHLIRDSSTTQTPKAAELWIDAGFKDKHAAQQAVQIGDPVTYIDGFMMLQDQLAVARGFDNKAGAFVVAEALRAVHRVSRLKPSVSAVATVQEEIGLRGAKTSAFGLDPDIGIAVDVTWATDHPTVDAREVGEVKLGLGPVIPRGPNINPALFRLLCEVAEKQNIPYQIRAIPGGAGNDGNAIQLSRSGVATAIIGIPQRYMHTPVEVCHLDDLDNAAKLIASCVRRLTRKTDLTPS